MKGRLILFLFTAVMLSIFIAACSDDNSEEVRLPEPYEDYHFWTEKVLYDSRMEIWADKELQVVEYTRIAIFFPEGAPQEFDAENFSLDLIFQDEERLTYGVSGQSFEYNAFANVYESFIVPDSPGIWKLEFNWDKNSEEYRTYYEKNFINFQTHPRVIAYDDAQTHLIIALIQPEAADVGAQDFRIGVWQPEMAATEFSTVPYMIWEHKIHPKGVQSASEKLPGPNYDENGEYFTSVTFDSLGTWMVRLYGPTDTEQSMIDFLFDIGDDDNNNNHDD